MTNIYQQRIQEWTEKYGGLSPAAEAKIKKLLEEFIKREQNSSNHNWHQTHPRI